LACSEACKLEKYPNRQYGGAALVV
jgi:hypothetical protein